MQENHPLHLSFIQPFPTNLRARFHTREYSTLTDTVYIFLCTIYLYVYA